MTRLPISDKPSGALLWENFKRYFEEEIRKYDPVSLKEKMYYDGKLIFYKDEIFPAIAERINLHHLFHNYLNVDATFVQIIPSETSRGFIPIICIELNTGDMRYIYDENLSKLCSINAPLKVAVINNFHWDHDLDKIQKADTQLTIDAFIKASKFIGYLGFIVSVRKPDNIKFHCFAFDENGTLLPEEVIELNY